MIYEDIEVKEGPKRVKSYRLSVDGTKKRYNLNVGSYENMTKLKGMVDRSMKMNIDEESKGFLSIKADQNKTKKIVLKKDRSHNVKNIGRAKFELVKKRQEMAKKER